MRSHIAASLLVWKLSTSAPSSRPSAWSCASISASVTVPYCTGSRLPNMLWLMPCSMRIFMASPLLSDQWDRHAIDDGARVRTHVAPPCEGLGRLLDQHADAVGQLRHACVLGQAQERREA